MGGFWMLKERRVYTSEFCIIPVRVQIDNRLAFLTRIREIGEHSGVTIVCLNRDMIAGYSHVKTALIHALRSWNEDRRIARSLEVEVLLYAAGTRQTGQIAPFGPDTGENNCYLCIIPPDERAITSLLGWMKEVADEDRDVLSKEKKKRLISFFSITPEELEIVGEDRIVDLVCERCALLTVNR